MSLDKTATVGHITRYRQLVAAGVVPPRDFDPPLIVEAMRDLIQLGRQVAAIRQLHHQTWLLRSTSDRSYCHGCGQPYPCPTIEAIGDE